MHRLFRVLGIATRAPIGFVHGLLELSRIGARQSYYRGRYPGVRFDWGANVDESCDFDPPVSLFRNARIFSCQLGRYTYIGHDSQIESANIGRFCSIGPEVMIGLAAHPLDMNISTSPAFYKGPSRTSTPTFNGTEPFIDSTLFLDEHKLVTLGHDVWIGARAIIRDGISIGNGAVVAAGAVVTRNIPPYAIAAGVPARILRYRFEAETIASLQQLRWWDQDIDWLRAHACEFVNCHAFLSSCLQPAGATCP